MGKGIVDELKKEFTIEDEWVSFEIHPETPSEGVLLSEKFKGMDTGTMFNHLKKSAAAYGIEIGSTNILANSKLSLMASEYAKDMGRFHEIHGRLFHDYFTAGKNIGDLEVILESGESVGLEREELKRALLDGRYEGRLNDAAIEAESLRITGTPTFIINNQYKIVGAQPIETFRKTLREIEKR